MRPQRIGTAADSAVALLTAEELRIQGCDAPPLLGALAVQISPLARWIAPYRVAPERIDHLQPNNQCSAASNTLHFIRSVNQSRM